MISTRDCFVFNLHEEIRELKIEGRPRAIERTYYFKPDNLPENYEKYLSKDISGDPIKAKDPKNYPVGCKAIENFFTH